MQAVCLSEYLGACVKALWSVDYDNLTADRLGEPSAAISARVTPVTLTQHQRPSSNHFDDLAILYRIDSASVKLLLGRGTSPPYADYAPV